MENSTEFSARIDFVLFPRNGQPANEDGFTIAKATHEGTGEQIVLKGKFGPVHDGELIHIARGAWRDDARYGSFFQVWARSHKDPVTREALQGYLEHLPGVGPVMAAAIIDQLGTDCLAKIDDNPSILLTVNSKRRGIRPQDLDELMESWENLRVDRKNMLYLSSIGLGDATAKKVSRHFRRDAVEIIRANPYAMTRVSGVGFKTADAVAQKLGIHSTDPRRLAAGMEYLLEMAENDGHVCLSREEMLRRGPDLLDRGFQKPTEQELNDAIDAMVAEGRLWTEVHDGVERVYTTEMFVIETRLYEHLERMLKESEDDPDDSIPKYEFIVPKASMLTEEQWAAVVNARHKRLSLLTGGPGTGKTTTLLELVEDLERKGQTYACLAPTGKAAKRMKESTGRDAQTIHRKLGWTGREAPTQMATDGSAAEVEPFEEDVIIVDEASMLDMRLAERLFSHVGPQSRVVLVGDPDQLPAVGAGSVLLDLIESGRVPTTKLTQIHRQGAGSLLVENAHRIRQGLEPFYSKQEAEAATGQTFKEDFRFVEVSNPDEGLRETLRLADELSDELGVPRDDILVTTAMRKGTTGTNMLHRAFQQRRNPGGLQFREGDQPLRVGDRVMNTKNRYGKRNPQTGGIDPDIMNGDIGRVLNWDPKTRMATVEFEDGTIKLGGDELDALIGAYACTTHKLQGSEAPGIVCPYVGSGDRSAHVSRMYTRNHIYTSLTRGKQMAVLVGQKHVIAEAVKRDGTQRNTTLDLRVGSIPKRLRRRYDMVRQTGLRSAQQLLGGFALSRVGHVDLTPAGGDA